MSMPPPKTWFKSLTKTGGHRQDFESGEFSVLQPAQTNHLHQPCRGVFGLQHHQNLALSIAAIGMLPRHNAAEFDIGKYLLHSLSTAVIAKKLALRMDDADPMDCFIGGLLHDFGKVVCAQFMPNEFKQALAHSEANGSSLHEALQQSLGADHAVIGAMLVEKWRFAPSLIETIAHQYDTQSLDTDLFSCVYTANQISKKLGFGLRETPVSKTPRKWMSTPLPTVSK